ncbi:hypothetical protein OTU49_000297, partial [Cherax quadricarinatus]
RSSVGQNQSGWNNGPPANKMMRMDMGGGYDNYRGQTLAPSMHQPARKFPQRDHQFGPRRAGDNLSPRRGRGGRFLGQAGRQVTTEQQSRKTVNDKKGMAKDNKGLVKDQKKEKDEESAAATTGTTGGQKGDKTEGDDSSATADPKQSYILSGEVIKEDSKEGKENGASCEEVKKEEAQSVENSSKKDPPKRLRSDGLIPKETLKCHMCNFYQFNSLQGFKNHLESRNHEQMSRAFHAKGVAVLNLLKAQARLAAQRNILKQRRMGMKGRISNCSRCDCSYMGSSADHSKLREHYLITTFAKCSPCRIWFKNRADLEIHRLSDIHLMRQMVIDKKRLDKASNTIKIEEDAIPEHESMKKVHDAVSKLKATHSMRNVWTAHRLPFYDPAVPIGLNFIIKKSNYYCKICQNKTMQSAKEAQAHFCSREHYDNYASYLKNLEDTKELEKTKQEENGNAHENIVNEEDKNQQENNTIPQDKENQREDADEDISNVDTNDVEMLDKECDKANVDSSSGPTKKTQKNGDEYYGDIIDRLENEDLDMMDDESDEEEQVITDKTTTKSGATKAQKNTTKCDSDISSKSDKSAVSAMEEVLSDTDDTKKNNKSSSDIQKDDGGRSDMDNTGNSVDKASAVGVADDEGKKSEDECEAAPAVSTSHRKGRGKGRGRGRATRK